MGTARCFFTWNRRYPELYNNISLQKGDYKLVAHTNYNAEINDFELFDIKSDPGEKTNLVKKKQTLPLIKTKLDSIYKQLIALTIGESARIFVGNKNENPVFLNRNDAAGERGIWDQEEIYGKWLVNIAEGNYNIRFRFLHPVEAGGQMVLETGTIVNQTKIETGNTDVIEMKNVRLPALDCDLTPFYSIGNKNILPFWVELERTE